MHVELNLDLSDLEIDILNKEKIKKENEIQEIERNKFYEQMANKYHETLNLTYVQG